MRFLLPCLWLCVACASTSSQENKIDPAARAETDACLANPKRAKEWGECNVKHTLYSRREALAACEQRHRKKDESGVLLFKIRLSKDGRVKRVHVDETPRPANRPLELCVSQEIGRLQFAPPPAGVRPVVYFPFQL